MRIGIDVGGTHTDAVLIAEENGTLSVAKQIKVATDHYDLLASVRIALAAILDGVDTEQVVLLTLSTTLSTNAIVEGRTEDVGVLVSGGPGIDPENFRMGKFFYSLDGSIDHRGEEIFPVDSDMLAKATQEFCHSGLRVFAAVSKFSTRNNSHEKAMSMALEGCSDFVTLGHSLSGQLSYPRRIATAYYNSAVWRVFGRFADAIEASMLEHGLTAPVHILKADGGTMPLSVARNFPVESILSGPAASVMGIISLCDIRHDAVILDIGGTTTDIALFAQGAPLIENEGITVGSYPTLVRALQTTSIGIGGDSRLHMQAGKMRVGPERVGPSMAQGGKQPTLMDALSYKGLTSYGDTEASRKGIEQLASLWDMFPEQVATDAIETALASITAAVKAMLEEVNAKPVYTIMELLEGAAITPKNMYVMGGPAAAFAPLLQKATEYTVTVPDAYAVANAIGAALTRTTFELELFADTEEGVMLIPTLDIRKKVNKQYLLEDARKDAVDALLSKAEGLGLSLAESDVDIVEASSFNMVGDWGTTGRNIRVKCQVRPQVENI